MLPLVSLKVICQATRAIGEEDIVVYDYDKCVQILMQREQFTEEEAEEWMDYNVVCARSGDSTPGFLRSQ